MVALSQILAAPEAQVRLNAAVCLAYLRCGDGLEELIEGLYHPEPAIALVQVPEIMRCLTAHRRLGSRPGSPYFKP